MEGETLKDRESASAKKGSLKISEDALKTAKERIFRLKKKARKGKMQHKNADDSLNGTVVKKKASRRPVVYIGHLPHGFYEEELRSFFTQFGQVCRVKVSRSKKTGNSKGYAFVEFSDDYVAQIAAETMNNYLMFERLLKTKYIPAQRVHPKMFPSRWITPESYPTLDRRQKMLRKQQEAPTDDEIRKHKAKVIKSMTRSLAVLHDLGINDYLPLVYDPPRSIANASEEQSKVAACDSNAVEEKAIQGETKEETVQAAPALHAEATKGTFPAPGTPVNKKAEKLSVKTTTEPISMTVTETVRSTPAKASKSTPAQIPANIANAVTAENKPTPGKTSIPSVAAKASAQSLEAKIPAKSVEAKTPAKSVEAKTPAKSTEVKTPAKSVETDAVESEPMAQPFSTAPIKTSGKIAEPSSKSVKATPVNTSEKMTPAKTLTKTPAKSVDAELVKPTLVKTPAKTAVDISNKNTPAKAPSQNIKTLVGKTVETKATPTPAKTLKSAETSIQSTKPNFEKTANKPAQAKTPVEIVEEKSDLQLSLVAQDADEARTEVDEKPTDLPVKATPAKRALAKAGVSTPAKTPKKTASPKLAAPKPAAKETDAKTPKMEAVKAGTTSDSVTQKPAEKMDVDETPKDAVEKKTLATPAKEPKKFATPKSLSKEIGGKTPSKQTPKAGVSSSVANVNGTPSGKPMANAREIENKQQATPKVSPRKRPAESEENNSPAKLAAVRTPVSILKSPAGTVVVTPISSEESDVLSTAKSPAITPPARRLTRAAAKRMSLKISPKMDVFSPRLTRKTTGTPTTPVGRRKSVRL